MVYDVLGGRPGKNVWVRDLMIGGWWMDVLIVFQKIRIVFANEE